MKIKHCLKRAVSTTLAGVMLASTVSVAPSALAVDQADAGVSALPTVAYEPIQLEAAPTKVMDYFNTQTPEGVTWVTDYNALDFMPAAAIGDVTCAVKATDGAIWVGTQNGLMRMDFTEPDVRDIVQYFAGNRYLYNGDDHVTGLAADDAGGVWVRNASGSVHIKMVPMTMEERTYFYEKMINDVNDRRGMITDSNSYSYDPATGEYTQTSVSTNDNDGLWSAMYAMGEILRYQTLKREGAPQAEIDAAKAAATRATKAVLLLDYVSGRGNGFPCRSYMLTSEAGAQLGANGLQTDGFWFGIEMLDEGEAYPDPIIDELKQDGKDPIGIATVRPTRDALQKRGSQIFPQDTDYNGLGLSQSTIDTFNSTRPEGQKLGTDIVSNNSGQVFPLMVNGINNKVDFVEPTAENPVKEEDIVFQLTAPVYEQIPTIFNDLFPDSAIVDGHVDMEQIVYKADTSSDEVDGHYALFLTAYRYLCDEPEDAELKDYVAEACLRMSDLILEDDRYYIIDATGKATQWSRWLTRYFNDSMDVMKSQEEWTLYRIGVNDDKEDQLSYGYEDGPLNALEVMAALKTAAYIAESEGDERAAVYAKAYDQCFESPYSGGGNPNDPNSYVNGKGYMDMALEYVWRRIVRQNTDAYNENDNKPVTEYTPGNKIFNNALHEDWTQYVNYSDEELGWFPVYSLVTLEEDPERYDKIVEAFDQWYEGQEEREENPFYTFLYQLAHPEKTDVDLQSAVRYFYRSPLVRNNRMFARGDRQDVLYIEAGNRDNQAQTNYALPLDEMRIGKDNGNPFARYSGYGTSNTAPYTSGSLDCCTVFTLPYWFGRYYGMITETEPVRYTRSTPNVTVESGIALTATVTNEQGEPLSRMIVDFYEDGAYIGRVRTDETGKATLNHTASGTVSVQVTERLIGDVMYNQVNTEDVSETVPTELTLSLPENYEMVVGDSHTIDFVILPESNPYRGVTWTSSDDEVATVDEWGRVTAHKAGTVTITATAKANPAVSDSGEITVVSTTEDLTDSQRKSQLNYSGNAAVELDSLQKMVDRYTKEEALADEKVPEAVKIYLNDQSNPAASVTNGDVTWTIETAVDSSLYVKRAEPANPVERDRNQYFQGERYLPAGTIGLIVSDGSNGIWVVSEQAATHIRMESMTYTEKAAQMSQTSQELVSRRGMVAEGILENGVWKGYETDNDGLWTGQYGVGELMRYQVLKDEGADPEEIAEARAAALNSVKAVLLLSNISCRTGTIDAYVRPLKNNSNQCAFETKYEGIALLKDKDYNVNRPQSSPANSTARNEDPTLFAPFFPEDWAPVTADSNKEDFATRTRTLEGAIARTYHFEDEYEEEQYGIYWHINDETDQAVSTAAASGNRIQHENMVGVYVDASGEIPQVLTDLLEGKTKEDIVYKTDTSTEELIGHMFIYKTAFDILDDSDEEERQVKELIVTTVRNIAEHLSDNGYSQRDATGQGSAWGKTELDYFNNSYSWEDCSMSCLVLLNAFKVASYITGEQRWENEYRMLALEEPYRYADLAAQYWSRWEHLAHVDGGLPEDAPQEEVDLWIRNNCNYSDEMMGMMCYYLLFQLETDETLLSKYRTAIETWWNSMQYSEDPLRYYVYQLAHADEEITDAYGNNILDTAAWTLSRQPIDTICWNTCTNENHPEAVMEGEISVDRETGECLVVPPDERMLTRFNTSPYQLGGGNATTMYPSSNYTLPYWMARYHGMITPEATTQQGPTSINLSLPETAEMVVGDSRSVDFVILPESNPYRGVTWTSSDNEVATVDEWGRVTAHKAGTVTITATAKANPEVTDAGTIKVVATLDELSQAGHKDIVNYQGGEAAQEVNNLQKYVDRYTKDEALASEDVPQTVKNVLTDGSGASVAAVEDGNVTWTLEEYGIKRTDAAPSNQRDAEQLFMGNRYLPDDADETPDASIIHMESDNANGLWVVSAAAVTHIRMVELSYTDKAAEMSATTQESVARRGMVSEAYWRDGQWVPEESDNDGLWTSMYGAGELMRYSVLKNDPEATEEEIEAARQTALQSIKAVLLLSNITCRTGTVEAYVRPLKNESNQYLYYNQFEGLALLKDKDFSINNPQSGPVDSPARVEGEELMAPFFPEDWAPVTADSNPDDFHLRTRTLEGMIARTYRLDGEYPDRDFNDGYYWDINGNIATCVPTTSTKVQWEKLVGQTVDASGEIPDVLADLLGSATKDNITYKTDTSTDEIIGHLFIYKIAYDILDDNNPDEKAIKDLLTDTVRRFAQHMVDNGYSLRDATGQATTWGKTERDYFNNAYAWEDCALNSLVNLCTFKLAAYVTGEQRWEDEYYMLAMEDPYRYADLAGEYWDRWAHLAHVDGGLDENASQDEIDTWIQQHLNYSDEEMAMLAYYILFQLEEDGDVLVKYQDGLDSWWKSMQYSENPLWYYIYQLAYPTETQTDYYGNSLVETASWALSRHPIDTIRWGAHNDKRPDVVQDEELSRDKETGKIRVAPFDERNVHKYNGSTYGLGGSNPDCMEGSTTYTLPYWLGRYHGMITPGV